MNKLETQMAAREPYPDIGCYSQAHSTCRIVRANKPRTVELSSQATSTRYEVVMHIPRWHSTIQGCRCMQDFGTLLITNNATPHAEAYRTLCEKVLMEWEDDFRLASQYLSGRHTTLRVVSSPQPLTIGGRLFIIRQLSGIGCRALQKTGLRRSQQATSVDTIVLLADSLAGT